MKVTFINPAADIRRTFLYRLADFFYGPRHPITGPLILGSILKSAGHKVEVYEELFENIDYEKVLKGTDLVGFYTMTSNAVRAYELADFTKNKLNIKVVIGGMHASVLPEEALKHADQVVVGEAENVIRDIVEGKINDKIVYASPVKDLDKVPFPDYSLLKTYFNAANILTSRGCPFSCSFCTPSRMFNPYRKRSPDNVIEELKIYKNMGLKYLCFQDDNFTADKKRVKEILRKMISNKIFFKETFFYARVDMFEDEELLDQLMHANVRRVFLGIESLNQDSLSKINKREKHENIRGLEEKLKKYKFKVISSIVLGLDHDNIEDVKKAIDFSKKINAYQLQPAILTPYPGTPIYEQMEKEGRILTKDWQDYDMLHVVFKSLNMSPRELQRLFFTSLKRFYTFRSALKDYRLEGFRAGITKFAFCLALYIAVKIKSIQLIGRA